MSMNRRSMTCVWTALLLLALLASPQKASAEEGVAIVTGITGGVETARAGEETWRRAEIGLAFRAGDRLRTSDGASATLLLGNGHKLSVLPNSMLSFSAEMGGEKGAASGAGRALKGLWGALVSKFSDSKDISAAKGVVGTVRGPKKLIADTALADDDESQLSEQVAEVEGVDIDDLSRHLMLGVLYERAKQFARAEENYLKAIDLSPGEGRLYDTLGSLYARLGQKDKFNDLKERKKKAIAQE
jgi:tetratricopeptide (TPR) repeat protein